MKTKPFLITIFAFLASCMAMAQKGDITLKGSVINESDGNSIEYANVALYYLPDSVLADGTVTDSLGHFAMKNCKSGSAYLKVAFIGYETKYISGIQFNRKQKEKEVDAIAIRNSSYALNEVTVSAERNVVTYKIDKKIVTLNALPNAGSGTAADALENVPGVSRDPEGNISIRGSSNFSVLIDGKPSMIGGNDLLKQLSAASIESIEIITNPSVKYGPDGTSGIVNIIMKKETNNGFSGIINSSVSTNHKYSSDVSLTLRNNKWNIFINPSYQDRTYYNTNKSLLRTTNNENTKTVSNNSKPLYNTEGYTWRTGIDYSLSDKTTFSYYADIGTFEYDRIFRNNFAESNSTTPDINYTLYENDFGWGGYYYMNYLNLQEKFKGQNHQLNVLVLYSGWNGKDHQKTAQFTTDENFQTLNGSNVSMTDFRTKNDKNRFRLSADYSRPVLKEGSFETGIQTDLFINNYDYSFSTLDTTSAIWYSDTMNSISFSFPQKNISGYIMFSYKIWGTQVQAGIRPEYYERDLYLEKSNQHYRFSKFGFYPSLHLSREFSKEFTAQASYSRRTNRPGEIQVNPTYYYTDIYFRRIGDPSIEPEYIDSYDLNMQKKIKKSSLSAEIYFRQTNNKINMIRSMENNILLERPVNINKDYSLGADISANIQLSSWWTISPSAEMFYYKFEGVPEGNISGQESNVFSTRINTRIKLTKSTTIQLTHYWFGSQKTATGESGASWAMNASLRQELFKKKLSVNIQCNDIFQSEKYITTISQPGYYYRETIGFYSPSFVFSLSYNFNNFQAFQRPNNSYVPMM